MSLLNRDGNFGKYWGNTYDSSTPLTYNQMQENALYLYNALSSTGWTLNSICGMLGNMQTESSINPGRWQNDIVGNMSDGYGLVQWTPATNYTNWVSGDPSTMDNQISRIYYELDNNLQWIPTSTYPLSFNDFKNSNQSPEYLAYAFLANYERPADPNQPLRASQAREWYNYLQNIIPTIKIKKHHFKFYLFNKNKNIITKLRKCQ